MKKYPCERCGTRHRPSRHHNLPKVFWNGYGGITWLCIYCHREIESIISEHERKASGYTYKVRRFRLQPEQYYKILEDFLNPPVIEYTFTLTEQEAICTALLLSSGGISSG